MSDPTHLAPQGRRRRAIPLVMVLTLGLAGALAGYDLATKKRIEQPRPYPGRVELVWQYQYSGALWGQIRNIGPTAIPFPRVVADIEVRPLRSGLRMDPERRRIDANFSGDPAGGLKPGETWVIWLPEVNQDVLQQLEVTAAPPGSAARPVAFEARNEPLQ